MRQRIAFAFALILGAAVGWNTVFAEETAQTVKVWVTANYVRLRADAGLDAPSLGYLTKGEGVELIQEGVEWFKVRSVRLGVGWVSASYLERQRSVEVSRGFGELRSELLGYAKRWLGTPYRYGADGPSYFDCSGFTRHVFRSAGYILPRTSVEQSRIGERVSRDELLPGDLVFFHTRGGPGVNHVGIYSGQGYFIHASSGRGYVTMSPLNEGYYHQRYLWAVRILPIIGRTQTDVEISGNDRETSG